MEIDIRGDIISNDDKWFYDWLEWDGTCPNDVKKALDNKSPSEKLTVIINSGGGLVTAGSEIYSMLVGRNDVEIVIRSMAGSAASVIAMANYSKISPIGLIMIHNVSISGVHGDYHEMEKNAEILKNINSALAQSYVKKTGKTEAEILEMMDKETWLTANQALELGFVDEILEENSTNVMLTNSINQNGIRLTDEIRERVKSEQKQKESEKMKNDLLKDLDLYGI
ncbi:MAG: Clp protease ClpP [Clostridiales bacterium]|nr:Clp protease ClpP [Clostridiales bacterium]